MNAYKYSWILRGDFPTCKNCGLVFIPGTNVCSDCDNQKKKMEKLAKELSEKEEELKDVRETLDLMLQQDHGSCFREKDLLKEEIKRLKLRPLERAIKDCDLKKPLLKRNLILADTLVEIQQIVKKALNG